LTEFAFYYETEKQFKKSNKIRLKILRGNYEIMGAVKVDIEKGDRMAKEIKLGEADHIKALIRNWHRVQYAMDDIKSPISNELLCIYVDLMHLINNTELTDRQNEVLELMFDEYTEEEIGKELNVTQQNVNGIMKSICKRIADEANRDWVDLTRYNYVPTEYKTCSKCKQILPRLSLFFSPKLDNTDGFQSFCKKCDVKRKKK
jgi:DNA-binding CsgD family transcriptional regulator